MPYAPGEMLVLHRFMQRIARMAALKQTDLRLTMAEATEIAATLAAVLAAPPPPPATVAPVVLGIDGGTLKS